MKTEIRIAGQGGQGVVLAGQILGKAAVYDGKNAVQTQSYGAEARGSAAKSEVIISDRRIGFPNVRKCDVLLVMNQEAHDTNIRDLKGNGTLVLDSTLVKADSRAKVAVFGIPATATAERAFGSKVYANMMMLGALTAATNTVSPEAVERAIEGTTVEEFVNLNKRAFRKGAELAQRE